MRSRPPRSTRRWNNNEKNKIMNAFCKQKMCERLISEKLVFDPDSGIIRWTKKFSNRTRPSLIAGAKRPDGYIGIAIGRHKFLAHRVAWFLHYRSWPTFEIDHINGIRSDNRISNLRIATHSQNNHNSKAPKTNTSGVKGVSFHKPSGLWHAQIKTNGKSVRKYCKSFEDAVLTVQIMRKEMHREFAHN